MSDPQKPRDCLRRNLTRSVIGRPLIDKIEAAENPDALYDVIIDPNLDFIGGREKACERIIQLVGDPSMRFDASHSYVFATLSARSIREIVAQDAASSSPVWIAPAPGRPRPPNGSRAIHRIWEDTEVEALLTNSLLTVKADAAQAAFSAEGAGIVWAVVDSGIDSSHVHFERHANLNLSPPLGHQDFTPGGNSPLTDEFGHGTHVAGIVAGIIQPSGDTSQAPQAVVRTREASTNEPLDRVIRGVAPRCGLVSLKVLDRHGKGKASAVIEALAAVQKRNDFGRRIVIHGVNLSLGYAFLPEWFACGQSPLCAEVNRLVKSGVVVVAAAGNSGYGSIAPLSGPVASAGLPLTINDPGNAELAITVGSTHREMPHIYGVSWFSSKGPTGDGRLKPDLVAPGERILSCGPGKNLYAEDSGTSMAACRR